MHNMESCALGVIGNEIWHNELNKYAVYPSLKNSEWVPVPFIYLIYKT